MRGDAPLRRARPAPPHPRTRAASDPGCAGCPQLGIFRALRRAGLELQGGSGCDPEAGSPPAPGAGALAVMTGCGPVLANAGAVLARAAAAGARLLVVVDRRPEEAHRVRALLAASGAAVRTVDPEDLAGTEAAVRAAAERGGMALVALASCPHGEPAGPPLRIAAARCNRCGACLSLACPALRDAGGDAIVIEPEVCTGCGLCASLCRSRAMAIAP